MRRIGLFGRFVLISSLVMLVVLFMCVRLFSFIFKLIDILLRCAVYCFNKIISFNSSIYLRCKKFIEFFHTAFVDYNSDQTLVVIDKLRDDARKKEEILYIREVKT